MAKNNTQKSKVLISEYDCLLFRQSNVRNCGSISKAIIENFNFGL